eukprot:6526232-Prymnesium_polylepis.1
MMMIELALILVYTCTLLIKTCDLSSIRSTHSDADNIARALCASYGLGDTASGETLRSADLDTGFHRSCDDVVIPALARRRIPLLYLLCALRGPSAAYHWSFEVVSSGACSKGSTAKTTFGQQN